jgi:hypothetical protein
LISLPEDSVNVTEVNLDFREPPRARVAVGLSVFSWLFIGLLASPVGIRQRRRHTQQRLLAKRRVF